MTSDAKIARFGTVAAVAALVTGVAGFTVSANAAPAVHPGSGSVSVQSPVRAADSLDHTDSFKVFNKSSKTLVLAAVTSDPSNAGDAWKDGHPAIGTQIAPGGLMDFEMVWWFFTGTSGGAQFRTASGATAGTVAALFRSDAFSDTTRCSASATGSLHALASSQQQSVTVTD